MLAYNISSLGLNIFPPQNRLHSAATSSGRHCFPNKFDNWTYVKGEKSSFPKVLRSRFGFLRDSYGCEKNIGLH